MNIVNLTPHTINTNIDGVVTAFPASGSVARMATTTEVVGNLNGIPVRRTNFGEVQGLPEPIEGTVFLTSTLIAQAARRSDVVSPDTGPSAIRANGQVVAVTGFQTF